MNIDNAGHHVARGALFREETHPTQVGKGLQAGARRLAGLFFALGMLMMPPTDVHAAEQLATDENLKFFKDLAETRAYTLGRPVAMKPTPDGSAVLFLRGGARDPVLRLYELDIKSGKTAEVLTPEAVLRGAEEQLSVEERARRERQRMSLRGFTGFGLSEDGKQILLTLSGRLYVVRRSDKQVTALPGEGWIDPHFSPDGRFVAAVRDNEVHVIDVGQRKATQLTHGASQTIHHGVAEFVAQEEMDRFRGFWWSPDSSAIAYQETDLSPVERLYIADPAHPERPPEGYFYPRAGTPNAKVRLGVVPRDGGETTWIRWDAERFPYLARVDWSPKAPLTLLVQTRQQRDQQLLAADAKTGATRELLAESDPAWINLERAGNMPMWLADGSGFLWMTERRGNWQVELRGKNGELVRELTPLEHRAYTVLDADEETKTIVYKGGPDARESHLYRVSLEGGKPTPLTREPGVHSAVFSSNHAVYVHSFSLMDGASGTVVKKADGKRLGDLPSVAERPPFLPKLELTRVGKERVFDAALIRPRSFEAGRKYPVILQVYAGPTVKTVVATPEHYLKMQWMADQGYVVAMIDGRGTPARDREWERAVRGNLIDIALEDQVAGLKALGEKYPELDLSRVGVTGWSFGGYFSAMATLRRPDVFRAGVAGAPVTDWRDYDTHYTERYMDLPENNPDGYRRSSALTYAPELIRPLLLIHGLTDDNVYFVHAFKLAEALFMAGKSFELLPLTGTHMAGADPNVGMRMQTRIVSFFDQHLKSDVVEGNAAKSD